MYYTELMTMEAIAREFQTSRSTVSRWITYARESGHIQILVHESLDSPAQLERQISERFGVRAVVVPVSPRATDAEALEATAAVSARTLAAVLRPTSVLGVAWGTTMSAVARHLPPKRIAETTVVQLNGAGNTHTSGIGYASEILRRFGQAFGASVEQFPVPAFFDSPVTRQLMWQERSVRRVTDLQRRMSVAIFGVGHLSTHTASHVYSAGYLEPEDIASLRESGVVGDVAARFFRADGSSDGIPLNSRSSAPEFAELLLAGTRICVVSDAHKAPGVHAALLAGLITDLILDDRAARALLAMPAPGSLSRPGSETPPRPPQ